MTQPPEHPELPEPRDLWGYPIPDPLVPTPLPLPGPHHLCVPSDAAEWFREYLLSLAPNDRDRAIQDYNDKRNRRRKARDREHRRTQAGNPLLLTFGPGPDGATCSGCAHLLRLRYHDVTYRKCELRGTPTHGTATDHRAKWLSCGKFQPAAIAPAAGPGGLEKS